MISKVLHLKWSVATCHAVESLPAEPVSVTPRPVPLGVMRSALDVGHPAGLTKVGCTNISQNQAFRPGVSVTTCSRGVFPKNVPDPGGTLIA